MGAEWQMFRAKLMAGSPFTEMVSVSNRRRVSGERTRRKRLYCLFYGGVQQVYCCQKSSATGVLSAEGAAPAAHFMSHGFTPMNTNHGERFRCHSPSPPLRCRIKNGKKGARHRGQSNLIRSIHHSRGETLLASGHPRHLPRRQPRRTRQAPGRLRRSDRNNVPICRGRSLLQQQPQLRSLLGRHQAPPEASLRRPPRQHASFIR
jgi:hypothetical protein